MRAVRSLGDDAIEPFHLWRSAHDPAKALFGLDLLSQRAVFRFQLQVIGDAVQQQSQLVNAEGLGEIVVGAIFHYLHRRLHRAITGNDHYDSLRAVVFDLMQGLQTACSGKFQIE